MYTLRACVLVIGLTLPFGKTSLSGACGRYCLGGSGAVRTSRGGVPDAVREALGRLTAEGLTTAAGGRGVVVTDISLESIDELFELRETLEVRAAALAAQRGGEPGGIFAELHTQLLQAPRTAQRKRPPRTPRLLRLGEPAG